MDTYQAVYDAVRSRISGFDSQRLFDRIAQNFDISHHAEIIKQEMLNVSYEQVRPSVLFRPKIKLDINQWCATYGEGGCDCVYGFGNSPEEAMRDFDKKWTQKIKEDV